MTVAYILKYHILQPNIASKSFEYIFDVLHVVKCISDNGHNSTEMCGNAEFLRILIFIPKLMYVTDDTIDRNYRNRHSMVVIDWIGLD